MKIGIGVDHRGYEKKEIIKSVLNKNNIQIIDYGTNSSESVDYNDFALKVCNAILNKDIDYGILMCGTGIGMSIAANKVKGIMCAKVDNSSEAKLCKEHNNVNVISISVNKNTSEIEKIVEAFISSKFLNEERLIRRIEKIKKLEN